MFLLRVVVVVVERDRDCAGLWLCTLYSRSAAPYLGQLRWNRFFRVRFRHVVVRVPGYVPAARRTRRPLSTWSSRFRKIKDAPNGRPHCPARHNVVRVRASARCFGPARRPIEANAGRAQWPPLGILFRPLKSLGLALRRHGQGGSSGSRNDRLGPIFGPAQHFGLFRGRPNDGPRDSGQTGGRGRDGRGASSRKKEVFDKKVSAVDPRADPVGRVEVRNATTVKYVRAHRAGPCEKCI